MGKNCIIKIPPPHFLAVEVAQMIKIACFGLGHPWIKNAFLRVLMLFITEKKKVIIFQEHQAVQVKNFR